MSRIWKSLCRALKNAVASPRNYPGRWRRRSGCARRWPSNWTRSTNCPPPFCAGHSMENFDMAFIYLTERGQPRGKFDLPNDLGGDEGGWFRLGKSRAATRHGVVFEAQCTRASKGWLGPCAVKFLAQQDDVRYDRFQNELRIMRMLGHKQIARFFDAGQVDLEAGYRA